MEGCLHLNDEIIYWNSRMIVTKIRERNLNEEYECHREIKEISHHQFWLNFLNNYIFIQTITQQEAQKKLYISFSGNRTLKIYLKAHTILKKLKQESIWYACKNSRFIVCQSDNSKNIFRDNSRETVFYANGIKIML